MLNTYKYIIYLTFLLPVFSFSSPLELRKEAISSFHQVSWMLSEMTKNYLPHSNFNNYYQSCPLNLQKPLTEVEIKELQKLFTEADQKIKNLLNSIDAKKIPYSDPELDNEFKNPSQVLIEYEPELKTIKGQICYPKFSANSDNAIKAYLSPSLVPAFIYLEDKVKNLGKQESPFTVLEIGKYFGWYLEIRQHYNLLLEIFKLTQNYSLSSLSRFEVNPQVANLLNYTQQQYSSLIDAKKNKFYYFDSEFRLVEPPHERRLTPDEIAYAKMSVQKDYPHLLTGVKDLALNFLFQEYQLTKQFIKEEDIQKESLLTIPNACLEKNDDYLIQSHITRAHADKLNGKEEFSKLPLIISVSNLMASYVQGEKKFPVSVFSEYFYNKAYEQINFLADISKASFKARLSKEIKIPLFNVDNLFKSFESLFPYPAYLSYYPTNGEKLNPGDFLSLLSDKLQKWVIIVPLEYFESAKKGAPKDLIESLQEPIKALLIDSLEAYVLSQVSQNLQPFSEDVQAYQFKDYLNYYWKTHARKNWEAVIDSVELKKVISSISTEVVKNLSTDKAWNETSLDFSENMRFQRNLIQVDGTEKMVKEQVQNLQAEKFLRSLEADQFRENLIPFKKSTQHTLSELAANGISEPNATLAQDFTGLQKIFLQKAQENSGSLAKKIRQFLANSYQIDEAMVDAYLKARYPNLVSSSELRASQVLANAVIQGSLEEILNSNFDENRFTHIESQIKRYGDFMRFVDSQKAEKHYNYQRVLITQRLYNSTLKDSLEKLYQNQNNPKIFSEWKQILSLQMNSILKEETVLEVAAQDIWPDYLKYKKDAERIKSENLEIEKLSSDVKKQFSSQKDVSWPILIQYLQKNPVVVKKLYQNRLQVIFEGYLLDYFSKEISAEKKKTALFGITEELYTTIGISKFKSIDHVAIKNRLQQLIEQGEKDYKKAILKTFKISTSAYEFLIPYLEKSIFNNKDLNLVNTWYDVNLNFKWNEQAAKDDEIIEKNAAVTELKKLLSTGFAPIRSKGLIWLEDYYFEKVLSRQLLPSYQQVKDEFLEILNSRFEKTTLSEIEELKKLKHLIAPIKEYLATPGAIPKSVLRDYEAYLVRNQLLNESLKKWQKIHLILVKYFPTFSEEVKEIIKGEKNAKDFEESKIKEFIWDEFQNTTTGVNGEVLALTPNEIENDLKFIASQSQQKRKLKKEEFDIFATELSEYCKVGIKDAYFPTFEKNYQASLKSIPATIPADLKKYLNLNAKQFCEKVQRDIENLKEKFEIDKAWELIHLRELFFNEESEFNPILTPEKVYYFSKAPTTDFNVTLVKNPKTLFEQVVIKPEYTNYLWIASTLKNFIEEANLNLGFLNPLSIILSKSKEEKYALLNSFNGELRGKLFNAFNQSLLSKLNSYKGLDTLFPKNKVAPLGVSKIHHQLRLTIVLWKSLQGYQRKQLVYGERFAYTPLLNNLADYLYLQFYRYTPIKLKGTLKDFKTIDVATKALNINQFILEYESKYPSSQELPKKYSSKDWIQPVAEVLNQEENERGLDFFIWNFIPDSLRPETLSDYLDNSIAWDQYCYGEIKKGNLCQNRAFINYPVVWNLAGLPLSNEVAFSEYWQALLQSSIANKKLKDLKLPKGNRHLWNLSGINTIADFEKHPLKKQYEELLKLFDKNSKSKITPNTIGYFLVILNSAAKKSEPIDLYKKPQTKVDKVPTHRELLHLFPLLVSRDVLEINKRDFEGWKKTLSDINPSDWQHYYLEKYLASIGNGQSFYTTQVPACYQSKPLKANPSIISKVYDSKDKTEAYHNRFIKIQLEPQGYSELQKPLTENNSQWQLVRADPNYWQKISGNPGKIHLRNLSQSLEINESDLVRMLQEREKLILFKRILNEVNAEGSASKKDLENLWLGYAGKKITLSGSNLEDKLNELDAKAEELVKEKNPEIDKYFKLLAEVHLHEETSKIVASNIHNELKAICEMPNFKDVSEKKDFDKHKEAIKRLSQYNNIHKNLLLEENYSPSLHFELKDYLAKFKENNQPIVHTISQNIMTWGFGLFIGGAAIKNGLLPAKANAWVGYQASQNKFIQKHIGKAGVLMNLLLVGSLSADMVYRYHDKFIEEPAEFKKLNETRNTKSSVTPENSAIPLMNAQMISQIEQFRKKTQEDLYAWDTYAWMGLDATLTLPIITSIGYRFATSTWRYIRGGDRQLYRTANNYFKIDPTVKISPQKIKETLLTESPQSIERKAVSQFEIALGATEENGLIRIKPENAKYLQEDLAILRNQSKLKAEPSFQANSSKFRSFVDKEKEAALKRIAILENFEKKLALKEPLTRAEVEELMWVLPQDFAPYTRQVPFLLRMLGVDMPITQAGRDVKRAYKISQAYLDLIKEFHPEFRFTMAVLSSGKYNLDDFVLNETHELKKLIEGPVELEKHFREVFARSQEFAKLSPYESSGEQRLYDELSRLRRFYQYMTASENQRHTSWVHENLSAFESSKWQARHFKTEAKILKEKYGELTFHTYAQDFLVRKNVALSFETQRKMMNFKGICEWYDKEFVKVQQYARAKGYSADEVLQQMLGFKTRVVLDGAEGEVLKQLGTSLKENLAQSGWKGNLDLLRAIANEDYQQMVRLLFVSKE